MYASLWFALFRPKLSWEDFIKSLTEVGRNKISEKKESKESATENCFCFDKLNMNIPNKNSSNFQR